MQDTGILFQRVCVCCIFLLRVNCLPVRVSAGSTTETLLKTGWKKENGGEAAVFLLPSL
jgi:hypothetical protein